VKPGILNDSYLLINLVFIGIIISIITYSLVFSTDNLKYPVPSGSYLLSHEVSSSSGLSRSFSEIVRFNFRESKFYNPYGIRIFSFFASQLLMRIGAIFIALHISLKHRQFLILADATLSILLFILFFWPFIVHTAKQLVY
jgi:hypothetical protein